MLNALQRDAFFARNRRGYEVRYDMATQFDNSKLAAAFIFCAPLLTFGYWEYAKTTPEFKQRKRHEELVQETCRKHLEIVARYRQVAKVRLDALERKNRIFTKYSKQPPDYLAQIHGVLDEVYAERDRELAKIGRVEFVNGKSVYHPPK